MSRNTDLILIKGRWFFNRAWPSELWPVTGTSPFRRSLKTSDREQARRSRPEMERLYHAKVDEARAKLAQMRERPELTKVAADALAAHWFRDWLSTAEEMRTSPGSDFQLQQRILDAEEELACARYQLRMRDFDSLRSGARKMVAEAGYSDDEGAAFHDLLALLGRASVAALEVYVGRTAGDFGARPSDPFYASAMLGPAPSVTTAAAAAVAPRHTIADLEAAYRREKVDTAAGSTQKAYGPVFRLLREVLGADTDVAKLTRADGRRLREMILSLPQGVGKRKGLRDVTLAEAVAERERLDLPGLGPKTINDTYLGLLSGIFSWAVREGWMAASPTAGLRVKDPKQDGERRDPFTLAHLQTIFAAPPWLPRDTTGGGKPIRFWAPLLALYHGLRRGEIAKLQTADITRIEDIPVLLIRGTLKTASSRRVLPIHSELIRLGFLAYVATREGEEMLFDGEVADSRGIWGDALGDWFSRRVVDLGLEGTRLGMHSFRHSFQDRLREAGLHGTALGDELAGRARKRGDVSGSYGSGFATRTLKEAIERIHYEGLEIAG